MIQSRMVPTKVLLLFTLSFITGVLSECVEPAGGNNYLVVFMETEDDTQSLFLNFVNPDGADNTVSVSSPLESDSISLSSGTTSGSTVLSADHMLSGASRSDNVIEVTSSGNVVVLGGHGDNGECDGFLALPTSSLGTSYIPVTFWPPYTKAEVAVIALEDATTVEMTFPIDKGIGFSFEGTDYFGGDTLTVTLTEKEVFQIQDFNDLSGTMIESDKPIAVFSGNVGVNLNVDDFVPRGHLEAQMPPVDKWGQEFYVVPFPDRANTLIKFIAADVNTTVVITTTETREWTAAFDGDYQDTIVYSGAQYASIKADGPILVVSYAESGTTDSAAYSDVPAMLLVPAVSQYRKDYFVSWSTTNAPDLLLVVPSGEEGGVEVDGSSDASGWTTIPNSNFVGKVVKPSGAGTATITHDTVEFGAMVYGNEVGSCSFAYPAGLCLDAEYSTPAPETTKAVTAEKESSTTEAKESTPAKDTTPSKSGTTAVPDALSTEESEDTEASKAATTEAPEASTKAETEPPTAKYTGSTASPSNDSCGCPALFVTGPSSQKSIVGIYQLHSCLIADRQVYLHSSGQNYIYYNESSSKWVFASDLEPSATAIVESTVGSAEFPFDVAGIWDVFDDVIGWIPAETVQVECICTKPVCNSVTITSDDLANTFPGEFAYDSDFNDRPAYFNAEQNVYLYFHSSGDCHFWAVADQLDASRWLMYSYDISPRPNEVEIPWEVARIAGWTDDESLDVVCNS